MAEQHEPRFNTRAAIGNKISVKLITEGLNLDELIGRVYSPVKPFRIWPEEQPIAIKRVLKMRLV